MLLKNNKQVKYFSLNTNDKTESTKWNIPTNYNFSQNAKIALVGINNATDSNLNFVFCPTIKSGFYSSLNTFPLIYAGVGYNNANIINGKQWYDVNGAFLNEIELKTYSSPPQNDFSYSEIDGLKPNLWLKFDTGAITTNSGTDTITLTNTGTVANAGDAVKGNNSASFNGTTQYLSGTILDINDKSFSISMWIYNKMASGSGYFIGIGSVSSAYNLFGFGITNNTYNITDLSVASTSADFSSDLNNWVHLVCIYNNETRERMIYRNGVKLSLSNAIQAQKYNINTSFTIGRLARTTNLPYYWNGNMDDTRIYVGTVLNQQQINAIYNNTRINYPIIKKEALLLANTADNDPNIHTIPNLWCRFETGELTTNSGTETITLTNNGTTLNAGISVRGNNSASFNGTNQTILGNKIGLTSSFSISVWVYIKSAANSYNIIIQFFKTGSFWLGFRSTNVYELGTQGFAVSSSSTYAGDLNNWVHLVGIYNDITKRFFIYRNGVQISTSNNYLAAGISFPDCNFTIGSTNASQNWLNGNIDDLRVYTGKVLDEEEINRIYTGAKTNYISTDIEPVIGMDLDPIIWYKFDDPNNIGLDTMGKLNLGTYGANPLATYSSNAIRGSGSVNFIATQSLRANYNYSDFVNEMTICFWLKINGLNTTSDNIIVNTANGAVFNISRGTTSSNFSIRFFGSGGLSNHFQGQFIADSIWKHYVITIKNVSGAIQINSYLNGVFNATTTTGTWNKDNLTSLTIVNPTAYSLINLDDMRFYNVVLSQNQINELYAGNNYYNFPTTLTRYNNEPSNTTYHFEVKDDVKNIINHY